MVPRCFNKYLWRFCCKKNDNFSAFILPKIKKVSFKRLDNGSVENLENIENLVLSGNNNQLLFLMVKKIYFHLNYVKIK